MTETSRLARTLLSACAAALLAACGGSSGAIFCSTAAECGTGQSCIDGLCQDRSDGGPGAAGALGAACTGRADCNAGLGCLTQGVGFPAGTCSSTCDSAACPSSAVCVDYSSTAVAAKACMLRCSANGDCRNGYVCCASAGGACVPSTLCSGGGTDAGNTGNDGGNTGTDGGNTGTDGGNTGTDGGNTGTDGGNTGPGDGGIPAFKTCAPPGTRTVTNGGVAGPATQPTGCQKPVGTSALSSALQQKFGQHTVGDVINFTVPANTGSLTIVQQARSAKDSVTFQGQTIANAAVPTLLTTPNNTVLYDDNQAAPADGTTAKVWYQLGTPVTGVMTLPNSTAMLSDIASTSNTLPAGQWSVTVNDYAYECGSTTGCTGGATNGAYDVTVLTRPGPIPTSGTVDLAFYLISSSLSAASAQSDAKVKRFLDTLATIYGRAGLCLGNVVFYDVPAWAKTKYATGVMADKTGPCDGLDQMFTLSKPGDNTLNFFMVDSIGQTGGTGGGTIVGIDGSIPGPSSIGGTVKSGAVVNVSNLRASNAGGCGASINYMNCGADETAYITAHEGGHWMGLYHTTESIGGMYDSLADTPRCECSATCVGGAAAAKCCDPSTGKYPDGSPCDASLTRVYGASCNNQTASSTCAGANHLMFWVIDDTSVGNFSAEQGKVVRANPVIQ